MLQADTDASLGSVLLVADLQADWVLGISESAGLAVVGSQTAVGLTPLHPLTACRQGLDKT